MDQDLPSDMTDYWQEPASYFLLKGARGLITLLLLVLV
jgi:hypothetical protein